MTPKRKSAVEKLAMDLRRWGRVATKRVQAMTEKYGVVFDWYFDGNKG